MKNKKMNNKKSMPDFKTLVDNISFKDILSRYNLLDKMISKKDQLRGVCPIHEGGNNTSFSVNISKNVFKCFSCGSQGNILDFVVEMEKCSIYQAGCKLAEWFNGALSSVGSSGTAGKSRTVGKAEKRVQEKKDSDDDEGKVFGLGVCSKGLMAGRLVIPIHNEKGELVAYVGRSLDDQDIGEKYKFPPNFKKGYVLFNLNRVIEYIQKVDDEVLILVEGFFDVFRLYEMGYLNTVALMGSSMTKEQEGLLKTVLKPDSRVALMFDNDEAGINCGRNVASSLSDYCFVKIVNLPEGIGQPDQLEDEISLF